MVDIPITIILPVKHYVPRYLKAAVQSVLDQTSGDWRLILVADRSVATELKSFLQNELADSRVQLFAVATPNLAATINAGMKLASTEFVTLLLGDDCFAANAIEVLHRATRAQPHVDFFHSSRRVIDGNGNPISSVYASRIHFEWKDFLNGSPVKHLLCWRREMALAIGGVDEAFSTSGPGRLRFSLEHVRARRQVSSFAGVPVHLSQSLRRLPNYHTLSENRPTNDRPKNTSETR